MVRGLLQQGFEVYAHSSDAGRLKKLLAKAVGRLHVTMSLVDGLHVSQWVVGKCDKKATGPGMHPNPKVERENPCLEAYLLKRLANFSVVLEVGPRSCDPEVMHYLPQGAKAVVFSVPNPLEGRPDLEAGATLRS